MNKNEEVIKSWIRLTSIIRNNRIIKNYNYNEAIILNLVYEAYQKQEGVYLQDILSFTHMLKSLANRTINQLVTAGFVYRQKENGSNRQILYFVAAKEQEYLSMHEEILKKVESIAEIVGEEDLEIFISIVKRLSDGLEKIK